MNQSQLRVLLSLLKIGCSNFHQRCHLSCIAELRSATLWWSAKNVVPNGDLIVLNPKKGWKITRLSTNPSRISLEVSNLCHSSQNVSGGNFFPVYVATWFGCNTSLFITKGTWFASNTRRSPWAFSSKRAWRAVWIGPKLAKYITKEGWLSNENRGHIWVPGVHI